jgi:outer membrane protein assembly factor BamB
LLSVPGDAFEPTIVEWPQFRGDDAKIGTTPGSIPPTNETHWVHEDPIFTQSSFAIAGGRALVGSDDTNFYCLDADTGETLWTFPTNNSVQSSPLVHDERVYIGALDGHMFCLRLDTGSEIWGFDCGQVISSPALWNNTVYFGDQDGRLWAVDAIEGEERWSDTFIGEIWASPTVVDGRLYLGDIRGVFRCYDASEGNVEWEVTLEDSDIYSSATVTQGRVLIGTGLNDTLACLDAATGEEIWSFEADYEVYSSAAVHEGVVYCHAWQYLFAIPWNDPDGSGTITTDEALWSFETQDFEGGSSPVVAGGKVVVGSQYGFLYCLHASNGSLVWELDLEGSVIGSPAVAYNRVYIGSMSGKLVCVGPPAVPTVYTTLTPSKLVVTSGQAITIDINVLDGYGQPGGDAFMHYEATHGTLSATFGTVVEGAFRISWTAPDVTSPTTAKITASGDLQDFVVVGDELVITVEPAEDVPEVEAPTVARPGLLAAVLVFLVIDVLLGIVILRRRSEMGEGKP